MFNGIGLFLCVHVGVKRLRDKSSNFNYIYVLSIHSVWVYIYPHTHIHIHIYSPSMKSLSFIPFCMEFHIKGGQGCFIFAKCPCAETPQILFMLYLQIIILIHHDTNSLLSSGTTSPFWLLPAFSAVNVFFLPFLH